MSKDRSRSVLLGVALFVVACAVYWPGLHGQFQFDDEPNIINNADLHLTELSQEQLLAAIFSGHSSVFKRPLSMLSFALNHYFTGLNAFYFKLTNVVLHAVSAVFLFVLCQLLVFRLSWKSGSVSRNQAVAIGFFVALLWAVHPINLTSVLYVVQRMNSLSGLLVIVGMIAYMVARDAAANGRLLPAVAGLGLVALAGVAAFLAKENGVLLFLYCFIIELCVYRGTFFSSRLRLLFHSWFAITVLLPAATILVYTLLNPSWLLDSYNALTEFGLYERVLTEARVVWLYMQWILLPSNFQLGLFHDDIVLSVGILSPPTTLFALLAHGLVLAGLVLLWVRRIEPGLVLGVGIFYASQLIESTVLPLQLVHEHRNYIGSFGLLFGIASLIINRSNLLSVTVDRGRRRALIAVAGLYFSMLAVLCFSRASAWGNGLEGALIEVYHHPASAEAHYELGRQYALLTDQGEPGSEERDYRALAAKAFRKSSELGRKNADGLFALLMLSAREQQPIDRALIDELTSKLASGPFYASYASWLATLSSCYQNHSCLIEQQDMLAIFQAAMDNPSIDRAGLTRSAALTAVASFVGNVGGNYENALALSIAAAEGTPGHVQFRKNVIRLAIAYGYLDTAEIWIGRMEQDMGWVYGADIAALRQMLAEVKAGGGN